MKKALSLVLVACIMLTSTMTVGANTNFKAHETIVDEFLDDAGNLTKVVLDLTPDGDSAKVYVNGHLVEYSYGSRSENKIVSYDLRSTSEENPLHLNNVKEYKYTDFTILETSHSPTYKISNSLTNFDPSDWFYYGYYSPNPILLGSKPVNLYFHNVDEEPDRNRFEYTPVNISAGTTIGIISLVISAFTGNFSVYALMSFLGGIIIDNVLLRPVNGSLWYSTQRIAYAPIISGINVFKDAYITKLWLIGYDYINNRETIELANESYASNRGKTPSQIAFNAQVATQN